MQLIVSSLSSGLEGCGAFSYPEVHSSSARGQLLFTPASSPSCSYTAKPSRCQPRTLSTRRCFQQPQSETSVRTSHICAASTLRNASVPANVLPISHSPFEFSMDLDLDELLSLSEEPLMFVPNSSNTEKLQSGAHASTMQDAHSRPTLSGLPRLAQPLLANPTRADLSSTLQRPSMSGRADKALSELIVQAKSYKDITTLLDAQSGNINHIHIVVMAVRAAQLWAAEEEARRRVAMLQEQQQAGDTRVPPPPMRKQWSQSSQQEHIGSIVTPTPLLSSASSSRPGYTGSSKFGMGRGPLFADADVPDTGRNSSGGRNSAGSVGGQAHAAKAELSALNSRLTAAAMQSMDEMGWRTLSNLLWAWGCMRYHPGGDVLDRIMHLLASFKQRPKDIDLGQVLWALARLGTYPSAELWASRAAFGPRVCRDLSQGLWSRHAISVSAWALATLHGSSSGSGSSSSSSSGSTTFNVGSTSGVAGHQPGGSGKVDNGVVRARQWQDHVPRPFMNALLEAAGTLMAETSNSGERLSSPTPHQAGSQSKDDRDQAMASTDNEAGLEAEAYLVKSLLAGSPSLQPSQTSLPAKPSSSSESSGSTAQLAMTDTRMQDVAYSPEEAVASVEWTAQAGLLTPRQLAVIVWSAATLGLNPPKAWLASAQEAAAGKLLDMQPQDYVMLVWGLGKLGAAPSALWTARILSYIIAHLPGFKAQELSTLALGLAHVRAKPRPAWNAAFLSAVSSQLPNFNMLATVQLLWALANLEVVPPPGLASKLFYHTTPMLYTASIADCSMLLWSLAQLRLAAPDAWLALLVEQAYESLHEAEPRHVASMMWAFAKMQRIPPQPWLDRLYLETLPQLLHFSFGQLSQLVYALAVLQLAPPRQWLRALLRASHAKLGVATPAELANTLWGLKRMSFRPNGLYLAAVAERVDALADQLLDIDKATIRGVFHVFHVAVPASVVTRTSDLATSSRSTTTKLSAAAQGSSKPSTAPRREARAGQQTLAATQDASREAEVDSVDRRLSGYGSASGMGVEVLGVGTAGTEQQQQREALEDSLLTALLQPQASEPQDGRKAHKKKAKRTAEPKPQQQQQEASKQASTKQATTEAKERQQQQQQQQQQQMKPSTKGPAAQKKKKNSAKVQPARGVSGQEAQPLAQLFTGGLTEQELPGVAAVPAVSAVLGAPAASAVPAAAAEPPAAVNALHVQAGQPQSEEQLPAASQLTELKPIQLQTLHADTLAHAQELTPANCQLHTPTLGAEHLQNMDNLHGHRQAVLEAEVGTSQAKAAAAGAGAKQTDEQEEEDVFPGGRAEHPVLASRQSHQSRRMRQASFRRALGRLKQTHDSGGAEAEEVVVE